MTRPGRVISPIGQHQIRMRVGLLRAAASLLTAVATNAGRHFGPALSILGIARPAEDKN